MIFMYKTVVEAVLAHAKKTPHKPAVCFKQQSLTYGELAGRVKAFAVVLSQREHIAAGDIVMISALSKPEYIVAFLGAQYLGAVVVPVDKAAIEESLVRLYHFVEPRLFLTDRKINDNSVKKHSLREWYQEAQDRAAGRISYVLPDMDSTAEIIFTTGTTGMPKGSMLSYSNILAITQLTRDGVHRRAGHVELIPLPLHHSFGLRILRTILYIGATAVLQNGFSFPRELEINLDEYHCSGIAVVPASIEKLYRGMGDHFAEVFQKFQYMEIGAGSLSVGMKQKLLGMIPKVQIYNVWGSSETGGVIFLDVNHHPEHIASLGVPAAGVKLRIIDSWGKEVNGASPDAAGRMILRGEMRMQGYFKRPDLTEETIVDGYLYTGDLVWQTEDGYVYMLGRADDIINVGGEKVSPVEVENAASLYEGIQECACIGVDDPDGIRGQIPVLYIVSGNAEFDEKALTGFLSKHLEQYKIPKKCVVIEELPRNSMKKTDRRRLREMWQNRTDGE